MRVSPLLALALALTLPSCGSPESAPAPQETGQVAPPPAGIALEPIAYDEFSELIEPGAGCSFLSARNEVLLVATAPGDAGHVDAPEASAFAEGAVKIDGEVIVLTADSAGGYDALTRGAMFANDGVTILVWREEGEATPEGDEGASWPARLDLRKDVRHRVYADGRWACGG